MPGEIATSAPASVDPAIVAAATASEQPVVESPAAAGPAAPAVPERTPTAFEQFDKATAEPPKPDAPVDGAKPAAVDPAAPAVDPAKPVEAKPTEPVAPAEPDPAVEVEYDFKLPDVLRPDEARMGTFTETLKELKASPEHGQKLLDLAGDAMRDYAEKVVPQQHMDAWNETRAGWRKQTMADPELGGSRHQTALAAAARMRDMFVSSAAPGSARYEKEFQEFQEFDRWTGASDHPVLLRLLHNVASRFDEPQAATIPTDIRPPKGNGRAPRGGLYTHPSSANMEK